MTVVVMVTIMMIQINHPNQIRFDVVKGKLSGKVVKPNALSSIMHYKLQKAKSLFIEFCKEKLSRKVSIFAKFTKVSPRENCSTLNTCL